MKIRFTLIFLIFSTGFLFSQIIDIPDPIFKNRLIEEGVDTNNDGEIQESEAIIITNLSVNSSQNPIKIESLIGIEYFTNLTVLNCGSNLLSTLDLSSLTQLEDLRAYNNQLTSINLTGLTSLVTLWISQNLLQNIELSTLTSLDWLYCSNNQITNLDVSSLINLRALWASSNQINSINLLSISNLEYIYLDNNFLTEIEINHFNNLISLGLSFNFLTEIDVSNLTNLYEITLNYNDINELDCSNTAAEVIQCSNNPNLTNINVQNNAISFSDPDLLFWGFYFYDLPNLESICMDPGEEQALSHSGYDPENVTVYTGPNCTLGLNEFSMEDSFIYPNPIKDNFTINTKAAINNYTLIDVTGKVINQSKYINIIKQTVLTLNNGLYFLKLESSNGNNTTLKFIKE